MTAGMKLKWKTTLYFAYLSTNGFKSSFYIPYIHVYIPPIYSTAYMRDFTRETHALTYSQFLYALSFVFTLAHTKLDH